jgi:hypothetical protein
MLISKGNFQSLCDKEVKITIKEVKILKGYVKNYKGFALSWRWVTQTNEVARLGRGIYFSYMDGIDKFKLKL